MKTYTIYQVETGAVNKGKICFTFDGHQIFNTKKYCESKRQGKNNRFVIPVVYKVNNIVVKKLPQHSLIVKQYLENNQFVSESVVLTDEQKIKLEQLANEYFKKSISFCTSDLIKQIIN